MLRLAPIIAMQCQSLIWLVKLLLTPHPSSIRNTSALPKKEKKREENRLRNVPFLFLTIRCSLLLSIIRSISRAPSLIMASTAGKVCQKRSFWQHCSKRKTRLRGDLAFAVGTAELTEYRASFARY